MLGLLAVAERLAEESGRFWKKPGSRKENLGFAMRRRKKVCEEYKQQI
jgi:hypothetical protein